jgi:hypothetical protein
VIPRPSSDQQHELSSAVKDASSDVPQLQGQEQQRQKLPTELKDASDVPRLPPASLGQGQQQQQKLHCAVEDTFSDVPQLPLGCLGKEQQQQQKMVSMVVKDTSSDVPQGHLQQQQKLGGSWSLLRALRQLLLGRRASRGASRKRARVQGLAAAAAGGVGGGATGAAGVGDHSLIHKPLLLELNARGGTEALKDER